MKASLPNVGGSVLPPYAVLACSAVFFWSISIRALVYTVMPTVAADLRLSASLVGFVIAGMLLGYVGASWSAGWLPGPRKARIMAGVLVSVPGAVLISMSGNPATLLAGALMVGSGMGVYIPLGLSLIVEAGGTGRRAQYMAIHEVSATLASFSGSTYVGVILAWTDWRGAVAMWCGVGVAALLAFAAVPDRGEGRGQRPMAEPLPVDRLLLYCIYSYGAVTILLLGLTSVLPLIMVRAWGLDQSQAASVVGSTRLAGLVGVGVVGLLADRIGHRRMITSLQLLSFIGAASMALNGFGPLFLAGVTMVAAGAAGTVTLMPLVMAAAYGARQRERVMAVANGAGGLMGMVICPALFGVLVDLGFATGPIVVAAAATLVSILATRQIAPRTPGGLRS